MAFPASFNQKLWSCLDFEGEVQWWTEHMTECNVIFCISATSSHVHVTVAGNSQIILGFWSYNWNKISISGPASSTGTALLENLGSRFIPETRHSSVHESSDSNMLQQLLISSVDSQVICEQLMWMRCCVSFEKNCMISCALNVLY